MNMIEVNGVSICFKMANDRLNSLKEFAIQKLKGKLKFEEFWALQDVSFTVKKGEVVGIVGHNGAGKSTILKAISGIMKPTKGNVRVHGKIVPMLELGSGFDMDLSGRENVYLNGAILGYSKTFLDEKFDEILKFSELGEFIEQPIRNYSSGMLMRLAFSIATVVNPEILIVDEILAVGDADFQEKSKKRMLELMGGGTTVLFVSHSIAQIREMCDRVVWLDHGQVKMIGEASEICDAYQYKKSKDSDLSKLYFDDGTGFNERAVVPQIMSMDGKPFRLTYKLPQKCKHIRFDPVENMAISLSDFIISAESANANIVCSNGRLVDGVFYFKKDDPWLEISFSYEVSEIILSGLIREINEDAI